MPSSFTLRVLSANSATPMPGRCPSSFVLSYDHQLIIIDCGEGAQIKMSEFNIRRSRLDHILISHMHGDHMLGLPGLINSLALNGRTRPMHIIGPYAKAPFDLVIHELDQAGHIDLPGLAHLEVTNFALTHRIPTWGYRFDEVRDELNINSEAISTYNLTVDEILCLLLRYGL